MDFLRIDGIVIKENPVAEADKIVTILTGQMGNIRAYVRGARRPRNRFAASAQFLCHSNWVLLPGKDMYTVNSADVKESFYEIRNDVTKLTYGAHMAEILQDVILENQPANKTLQLFLRSIFYISKKERNTKLVTRIFELRLLRLLGYLPNIRGCSKCGTGELANYYTFKECNLLCDKCISVDKNALKINRGTIAALIHITNSKFEDLFNFNVSDDVLDELNLIIPRLLTERLEKKYTKLSFLDRI